MSPKDFASHCFPDFAFPPTYSLQVTVTNDRKNVTVGDSEVVLDPHFFNLTSFPCEVSISNDTAACSCQVGSFPAWPWFPVRFIFRFGSFVPNEGSDKISGKKFYQGI